MSDGTPKRSPTLPPAEAARWLGIDPPALRSLVEAKYLSLVDGEIPLAEVRAFQARNAEGGSGAAMGVAAQSTDIQAMIDRLDAVVDDLAQQAYERFVRAMPDAKQWSTQQQTNFVDQARGRFGAILAVTGHGSQVDEALRRDLEDVGANAAWAGASLPHLLLVLRISRDLLLQTAMRIAEEGQGRWNAILGAFTARMLPSIDRLTDAISDGFWGAKVEHQQEERHRLHSIVERAPYGFYEADLDGMIQYANPGFATLVDRHGEDLEGFPLADVLTPVSGSIAPLLSEPPEDVSQITLVVRSKTGDPVTLDFDTMVRRIDDSIVGFGGIVRPADVTVSAVDLTPLVRHIFELRRSLEILRDAGTFLKRHAVQMSDVEIEQAGDSVERQVERLLFIVEELDSDRKALQPPTGV